MIKSIKRGGEASSVKSQQPDYKVLKLERWVDKEKKGPSDDWPCFMEKNYRGIKL